MALSLLNPVWYLYATDGWTLCLIAYTLKIWLEACAKDSSPSTRKLETQHRNVLHTKRDIDRLQKVEALHHLYCPQVELSWYDKLAMPMTIVI